MRDALATMPTRSKLVLGGAVLAVVFALFLLLRMLGAPSYALLSTGLDPKEAGKITTALDEGGIGYELRGNGTSVAVEKAQVGKARIALADAGVQAGTDSGPGFELFDKQSMGASDMQQRVNYQRALEGEITRTVDGVQGVSGSQVQLVLPEDDLFADEASPATAAVLLDGSADALAPGAVRGIAQLVSSSVKGLKSDQVTITDGTGQVLWPADDGMGAAGTTAGAAKQAAEARYASALEANLNSMLLRTVGAGKAQVQVNADLDMDNVTRDELRYAKRGVPIETTEESERLRGAGAAAAGGASGTGANIPQYAAGATGGGGANSNYQRRSGTTKLGVDKTVSKVVQAPGTVKKLQVALVLDRTVADPNAVRTAVAAAAGIDPARGDQVAMSQMTFPKATEPKAAGPVPPGLMGPLKWVGLGVLALLFLLVSSRALRKRESDALADPEWLREINEPVRLAELESQTRVMPTASSAPDGLDQLDQIMDREPERVAAQVRSWMAED